MRTKIEIQTQYYENYNVDKPEEPYWKPKFSNNFVVELNDDYLYGTIDIAEEVFKSICKEQSNSMMRYDYKGWNIYNEPEHLDYNVDAEIKAKL